MKISNRFPNFIPAIKFTLDGLNYSLACNDAKKFSFMIPLASHKKGLDFYELEATPRGVFFTIETMLGFKSIKKTSSSIITEDLTYEEWIDVIFNIRSLHLRSEEYQALKQGYVKTNSGCFGSFLLTFTFLLLWSLYLL